MKTRIFALVVTSAFLFLNSCTKDEDPEPVAVTKVTFVKDVKPILAASCTPCHMAGGINPNKFDDYTTTKSKISSILDRVQREPSAAGFMPAGGAKLSASTITTLNKWVTDGLLEK